jgi:hypothetical protein
MAMVGCGSRNRAEAGGSPSAVEQMLGHLRAIGRKLRA